MRILIRSIVGDRHADVISLALRARGHQVTIFRPCEYPKNQTLSFRFENEEHVSLSLGSAGLKELLGDYDVVIARRITGPTISQHLVAEDQDYAQKESQEILNSINPMIGDGAFWVNPWQSERTAALKPHQLNVARNVGLKIPTTLMSNDSDEIIDFCERLGGMVAMKTFRPVAWHAEDGRVAPLHTSLVSKQQLLAKSDMLCFSPAIFQEHVVKEFEVRAFIVGHTVLSMKIHSQVNDQTAIDYRRQASCGVQLPCEQFDLPIPIQERVIDLMDRLGLVTGSVDLIVRPDGEFVFLEINPMGQFLFLEHEVPKLPVLSVFCDFVESKSKSFKWNLSQREKLQDLMASPTVNSPRDAFSGHLQTPFQTVG